MARLVDGVGIGKQLCTYKSVLEVVVLIFMATCASVPTLVAQPDLGFLSLDCGAQTNYTDSHTLQWETDEGYINTGNSVQLPSYPGDQRALGSFRYFPGMRSKYCYDLPTGYLSYLVRASFYMDESEFTHRQPFEFILSIDATDWFTVTSGADASQSYLLVQEAIFNPPYMNTSFCLRPVPGRGMPFISSLELRTLDSNPRLYSYRAHYGQILALGARYNAGAAHSVLDVRYPHDPYDRIWTTPDASLARALANLTSISCANPKDNKTVTQYDVPSKVMQDAWLFSEGGWFDSNTITLKVYSDGPQVYSTPSEYAFVVVYSEILNTSDPGAYELDIVFDYYLSSDYDTLYSSTKPNLSTTPFVTLSSNYINISVISSGNTRPSMNAVEVYSQFSYNTSITNHHDATLIEALKIMFSLTDWQGDPCVPVPYDWLSCDLRNPTFGKSQSTENISSHSIFATSFNVTSIILSNITTINTNITSITGDPSLALPLERLHGLTTMSITSSQVDFPTLLFLINYTYPGLETLDLSYNIIEQLPHVSDWAGTDNVTFGNLTTLDLSHNHITGSLISFDDVSFSTALQNLDLSYNGLTSFPKTWGNKTITSLVTLNLSHNQFNESVSSLDEFVQMNSGSLQVLDVSYNKLGGQFSSDVYFSLSNLASAHFDHNSIQGILNLSTWHSALQEAASKMAGVNMTARLQTDNYSSMPTVLTQLFSFMNNSISDTVPRAQDFDPKIQSLFKMIPAFGVMLDGNPYCNDFQSISVHKYLCRSSNTELFQELDQSNYNYTEIILIVSICGGVVALALLSITSATLLKLRKQLHALRGIQKALAKQKVQPPFYHYNDLKIATKKFDKSNKLGQGGFGVVYKGVLADETTLAVKKLFNSQTVQVIDEFLNEVVLITGIKHRNLVQLKGCCINDKQRILVYEYAEKGNLAEALWGSQAHGGLNWKQRLNVCVGVARGLSYLHEELQPSIIHRDIKPQNILLDNNFNPKIADFGLARHISEETSQAHYTKLAGTLGYFAPEYATQGQVSDKTDIYSYGILILEVVSGRPCIDPTRPTEEKFLKDWVYCMRKKSILFDVLQPELREDCNVAEVIRVINIALLCVQHRPDRRPTMSQVVTMLLGNVEIIVFSEEFDNIHYTLNDLMAAMDHDAEGHALQIIDEESTAFRLPSVDSQGSFGTSPRINCSRSSPREIIELSTVSGR